MNHTPEPWEVDEYGTLRDSEGKPVIYGLKDNMRRIAACVNACKHISTESLESGIQQNLIMRARIAEEQRDELLAALKACLLHLPGEACGEYEDASAAIAKVEAA